MHITAFRRSAKDTRHRNHAIVLEYLASSLSDSFAASFRRKRSQMAAVAPVVENTRGQKEPRSIFTILSSYSSFLLSLMLAKEILRACCFVGSSIWVKYSNVKKMLLRNRSRTLWLEHPHVPLPMNLLYDCGRSHHLRHTHCDTPLLASFRFSLSVCYAGLLDNHPMRKPLSDRLKNLLRIHISVVHFPTASHTGEPERL